MKHWTEPNGIFLVQIPTNWQYINPALEFAKEKPPYGFQPYEDGVGFFQIACYPVEDMDPELAKAHPQGVPELQWKKHSLDDDKVYRGYFYRGALADQFLAAKYYYHQCFEADPRMIRELALAEQVMDSVIIVPKHDRKLASDLDKYDNFIGALFASYDLLYEAIDSKSYIQIIALAANQIDAYLRLSIVLSIQLKNQTNEMEVKYLYQREHEKGIMERKIFDDALKLKVIDQPTYMELGSLYELRNRVIHRYIISDIKTRDLKKIVEKYLQLSEKIRLNLKRFEGIQMDGDVGIYGKKMHRPPESEEIGIERMHASLNDKHLLTRFKRRICELDTKQKN